MQPKNDSVLSVTSYVTGTVLVFMKTWFITFEPFSLCPSPKFQKYLNAPGSNENVTVSPEQMVSLLIMKSESISGKTVMPFYIDDTQPFAEVTSSSAVKYASAGPAL